MTEHNPILAACNGHMLLLWCDCGCGLSKHYEGEAFASQVFEDVAAHVRGEDIDHD